MVLITALGSALAYALAMVLQQRSAQRTDPATSLRPGLVVQLAAQRWWLVGLAANLVAFGLRAVALSQGALVLVQPLLLTGLFFALVLETQLCGRRLTSRDAVASAALIGGLSIFALAASPAAGTGTATPEAWLAVVSLIGLAAAFAVVQANGVTGERRAAWLAGAAGLLFALVAALTKQAASQLSSDGLAVLGTWVPYAAAATCVLAVVVGQSAFQAGSLRASLPVLSVVEPLTSIVIGAWAFHEQLDSSLDALVVQTTGLALLLAGVVALTTSVRAASTAPVTPATGAPATAAVPEGVSTR